MPVPSGHCRGGQCFANGIALVHSASWQTSACMPSQPVVKSTECTAGSVHSTHLCAG